MIKYILISLLILPACGLAETADNTSVDISLDQLHEVRRTLVLILGDSFDHTWSDVSMHAMNQEDLQERCGVNVKIYGCFMLVRHEIAFLMKQSLRDECVTITHELMHAIAWSVYKVYDADHKFMPYDRVGEGCYNEAE